MNEAFALQPPLFASERWIRVAGVVGILMLIALVGFGIGSPMHGGFREMTGLPCPLCGGTRATRSILTGHWAQAAYLNVLAFPAVFGAGLAVIVLTCEAARGRALADWNAVLRLVVGRFPLVLVAILAIYLPQLYLAVTTPKPELVDFKNPIAAALRDILK